MDYEEFEVVPIEDIDGSGDIHLDKNCGVNGEIEEPQIGIVFSSTTEAYNYYNAYAKFVGFSTRKKSTNRSKVDRSKILRCTLCCSCEGSYTKIKTPIKRREDRRFGCKAVFVVKLNKEGKYELVKFIAEHTHDLVPHLNAHFLRSHRSIKQSQAGLINKMYSAGIQRSKIHSYFSEEAGGAKYVGFTKSDCSNLIQRRRAEILKRGDALSLLDYFRDQKQENKHFFYSFQTNDQREVIGVFFCDATSRRDYGLFGDTMCFDTTFKTNNYNMICAPFVGVNNHGQTTIFGCGLVENERTESFVWLFNTFLEAMGGKKPETIFTDQAMAIANAIKVVFPDSHHRLCLWHLYQNALKNLSHVFSKHSTDFATRFKECIYEGETIDEFEATWVKLLTDFTLEDNDWLKGIYVFREKWAQVYARVHFCAGMTTTQRSESINKYLKMFFGSTIILRELVRQYTKAMDARRLKEMEEVKQSVPVLFSTWVVEREARKIYTRKIFSLFQDEYKKTLDLRLQLDKVDGDVHTYTVEEMGGRRRKRTITYNQSEEIVFCTCRKFEFHGILCSHALKLFRDLNLSSLPSKYYVRRWTKNVVDEVVFDSYGEAIRSDIDPLATTRYSELSNISQRLVAKGSKSNNMSSFLKSEFLQVEVKLDALARKEEEQALKCKKRSGTKKVSLPEIHEDAPLRDPKRKECSSQIKRKKSCLEKKTTKKKSSSKQNGGREESIVAATTMQEKTNQTQESHTFFQELVQQQQQQISQNPPSIEDSFAMGQGLRNDFSYNQINSQVYQPHCIFPPYQVLSFPGWNCFPSQSTSQQASSSQMHELQGVSRRLYFAD